MISQVPWWVFSLISVVVISAVAGGDCEDQTKVYIVYLGEIEHNDPDLVTASHIGMLASLFKSEKDARESMIYSYRHGFSGFAAHMTDCEAKKLSEHPDVVQVTPNHYYKLQTTRTFNYLGIYDSTPKELLRDANMGEDVIIGVFDTGVWPESESFNDRGLGPIPTRWKGKCVDGQDFDSQKNCNKKLIGAKYYIRSRFKKNTTENITSDNKEYMSPRDSEFHGTHVASTAGGAFVPNVSNKVFGVGTARGGAPSARIAVYKVCWNRGSESCAAADILKAMDDAIEDGVDVMSLSLGGSIPILTETNEHDGISYGAFHAISKGIPVLCAGGNDGPEAYTIDNIAPWIITVAATTLDRWFPTPLALGNNATILARYPYKGQVIQADLMYVANYSQMSAAKGKVVLAFLTHESSQDDLSNLFSEAMTVGLAALVISSKRSDVFEVAPLDPALLMIDYEQGTTMLNYIGSTSSPTVKISPAITLTGPLVATKVADFSSRGPNSVSPYVLKPDVAAPGVGLLAASTPFKEGAENGFVAASGTSMSTPVVAGLVALLRAIHREWSPAAIHSALVTTASTTDPYGEPIFADGLSRKLADPFDFGGGLVNPTKAADPGLVYDACAEDYLRFLCASGYEETSIANMAKSLIFHCPSPMPSMLELNLPSITIPFLNGDVTVTRTVTNVGPINSIYRVIVQPPLGVKITVTPNILLFNCFVKKLSFEVTVSTTHKSNSIYYFGSITWTDGSHIVTIPLSVRTQRLMYFNH